MSLQSAPFPNPETPQSPLSCTEALPDAFPASNLQTLKSREPELEWLTQVSPQAELATLQSKAIRSIELCQQMITDFIGALDGVDGRPYHRAGSTADRVSFVDTEAAALEAFITSAKNLVISLSDPDQPKIPLRPAAKTANGKLPDADLKARLDRLTERQKCVFQLVAQGLSNKLIAYELGITETTVKAHVGAILQKLGVYSRARAIVLFGKLRFS